MNKILLMSFLGILFFSSASAHSTILVEVPSTFSLKVGEGAGVKNYQNMEIDFQSVTTDNGECQKGTTPCPLGNPVNTANPRKAIVLHVTTPGGCGPGADSRCLGGPAFSQTFTLKEGSSANILGLKIGVKGINDNSATFSIAMITDDSSGDSDDTVDSPHPLPPVVKVIPVSVGQGTIKKIDKIIICPNGEVSDNCSVCANGECRTGKSSEAKVGVPTVRLNSDETFVSAVKAKDSDGSNGVYEIKARRKARILFVFPVNPEITYSVTATGSTTVSSRPWWNFLAW